MRFRKSAIGAGVIALVGLAATAAYALPFDWQLGFQPSASPVMDQIESFHKELLYIITAVCIFVAGLLGYVIIKFRASANPVPSKVHHNTILEVAWTLSRRRCRLHL
jgi:cytochrome c oxidase subunit 2